MIGRLCALFSIRCYDVEQTRVPIEQTTVVVYPITTAKAAIAAILEIASQNLDNIQTAIPLWESRRETLPRDLLVNIYGKSSLRWSISLFKDRPVVVSLEQLKVSLRSGVFTLRKQDFLKNPNIPNNISLAIVYRLHCLPPIYLPKRDSLVDSSVVDYWFLKYFQDSRAGELTPKVYYLSSALTGGIAGSTTVADPILPSLSRFAKLHRGSCEPDEFWILRYTIVEKLNGFSIGDIVWSYWERGLRVPLDVAFTVVIEMVKTLQKLGELNVIHGDAHWNNFLYDQEKEEMKIIDFERARIFNTDEMKTYSPTCTLNREVSENFENPGALLIQTIDSAFFHRWATPADLMNCPHSFKDDIYKVFISLNMLLYGQDYEFAMEALVRNAVEDVNYWRFRESVPIKLFLKHKMKNVKNLFELEQSIAGYLGAKEFTLEGLLLPKHRYSDHDPVDGNEKIATIRAMFLELSATLFDPPLASESRPDYEKIITLLTSIKMETTSVVS